MEKKISIVLTAVLCITMLFAPVNLLTAYAGSVSVSGGGTVNIGDTVTVRASALGNSGETALATMGFSWDTSVMSFVSCSASTYGGGSGGYVSVVDTSASITLKAISAGTCTVSVSGSDGVSYDSGEEIGTLSGGSTTITVNNASSSSTGSSGTNSDNSDDSSSSSSSDSTLASLKISPGTLSPSFSRNTKSYRATVEEDVTNITVSATANAASQGATVKSVSGNEDLQMGENTVKIVVAAADGTTSTYTITVVRGAEEEAEEEETKGDITVGSGSYTISEEFTADEIPDSFEETTVSYDGETIKAVWSDTLKLYLVYLTDGEESAFFIYDQETETFTPFVVIDGAGDNYIILLPVPEDIQIPDGYEAMPLEVDGLGVLMGYQYTGSTASGDASVTDAMASADAVEDNGTNPDGDAGFFNKVKSWITNVRASLFGVVHVYASETTQEEFDDSQIYTVYAMNSDGESGWYTYDEQEGTYIRCAGLTEGTESEADSLDSNDYQQLKDEYQQSRSHLLKIIAGFIVLTAILFIILINFLVFRRRDDDDEYDDDTCDDDENDDDENDDDEYDESDTQPEIQVMEEEDLKNADAWYAPMTRKEKREMKKREKLEAKEAERASKEAAKAAKKAEKVIAKEEDEEYKERQVVANTFASDEDDWDVKVEKTDDGFEFIDFD